MHEQDVAAASTGGPLRFSSRGLFLAFTIFALLIGALVLLVSKIELSLGPFPQVEPRPFEQQKWKAWSITNMSDSDDFRRALLRQDMKDDLLAKHDFTGWTGTELESLLGRSNPEFCPAEWDVAYLLGTSWVDYVVLAFRLDNDGKVDSYEEVMF
jgi:hypothetical protein